MKKIIGIVVVIGFILLGTSTFTGLNTTSLEREKPTLSLTSSLQQRDAYHMVIIAPSEFSLVLQPLIDHKNNHNIRTILKTTDEIYTEYEGRDNPERIKYFIKDAVEQWNICYVLLVGGKEQVPVRYVTVYSSVSELHLDGMTFNPCSIKISTSSPTFISDLYYADVYDNTGNFCNWDSNNNSVFGEVDGETLIDTVDLFPDVYIGRLLCQTTTDVEIVVNKIITYETTAYGQEWFNNLILCGGDTHPNGFLKETFFCKAVENKTGVQSRCAWEGEYMSDLIADILDTFHSKKYFASGLFGIRAKSLTTKNINTAINDGAGFLYFNLHGSPDLMLTFLPFNSKYTIPLPYPDGYKISEVSQLTNGYNFPIVVFLSCSTGDFSEVSSPFAWEFVKHETGGSIASFAPTTIGLELPGTLAASVWTGKEAISIFEAYADGKNTLGEIWSESIIRHLEDEVAWSLHEVFDDPVLWMNYLSLENWMLFGDPSLKIGGYP